MVAPGGMRVWLLPGGMRGCSGGHVWLLWGGMHGYCWGGMCGCWAGHAWLLQGVCMVAPGGVCVVAAGGHAWLLPGGHAWDTVRYGDMVNERAVRILLECILVNLCECSCLHI